jgi:GntR family transcriptional regulator / MocR family aminotransferase
MWAENLIVTLEKRTPRSPRPYHRQVFAQIRAAILDGTLAAGDRLPATRELALSLGVARNTVARAYEDLLAGGYLEGRVGSGTFVSAGIGAPPGATGAPRAAGEGRLRRAAAAAGSGGSPAPTARWHGELPAHVSIDLRPGTSDWDAFPRRLWLRLLGRALRTNAAELRRYGEPGGHFPLREAIARHLAVSRGVAADAGQVVIVNGSQQALDLVARLRLRPGDTVGVEDPGYPDARRVLAGPAARLLFIPVDEEGIDVRALEMKTRAGPVPRLVYVTPSHQYPTGAVLSLPRRLALLSWAARRDALIVEDDYDSEFHAPGHVVESLQGLDRSRRVIYIGTFSTVLFPPLRVGYVVLPPEMVAAFVRTKWLADRQTPTLEQLALTAFLQEGHFERHLRRMRRLVSARREAMQSAIEANLGTMMAASGSSTGMHVMVRVTVPRFGTSSAELEKRVQAAAAERGVAIAPAGPCFARPPRSPSFVLGYAAVSEEMIFDGTRKLARAVEAVMHHRA